MIILETPVLETARLTLRKMNAEDSPFMFELLNEPGFIRNIGDRNARTLEDAKQYILTRIVASYISFGYGLYLVELKDSKTPVGICGLVKREALLDADVGFAFLEAFWGKGYATESAAGVLKYAKDVLKLKRIVGITMPNNIDSIKVLEKIGLRFERMFKINDVEPENKLFSLDFM